MSAVVVTACGTAGGDKTAGSDKGDRVREDTPTPAAASDGADDLKRALLPMPPAQPDDMLRFGPVTGPYSTVFAKLVDGQAQPPLGRCFKAMSVPGRIEELGDAGRVAPAVLAMWTDRKRRVTVQETILRLPGASTRRLITTEIPETCRDFSFSVGGEHYRRTLKSDIVRQRDGASERIQFVEDRAGRATTRSCQLTHQREGHVLLLSISQVRAPFARTVCLDAIKEADDRATAALGR
jgi:hypothetical protein